MKVRLTRRALADLHAIAHYLKDRNPRAAERVEIVIRATLQRIAEYPSIGRHQAAQRVRKAVTPEFGYIIYYEVDESLGEIAILAIQHGRQERPFDDA